MSVGAIFLPGRIQFYTSALYALPCQTPFCQTAPLLLSITQQHHLMEYWWEGSASTAVPPPSASDIVIQYNKIGGIAFGAVLIVSLTNTL